MTESHNKFWDNFDKKAGEKSSKPKREDFPPYVADYFFPNNDRWIPDKLYKYTESLDKTILKLQNISI